MCRRLHYVRVLWAVAEMKWRQAAVFGAPHRINITNTSRRSHYPSAAERRNEQAIASAKRRSRFAGEPALVTFPELGSSLALEATIG
jgi:hypothetical protein